TGKDISISEPIPSSTPGTGWKDGLHTSRSPLRQQNRSQRNGSLQHPPRPHADGDLRARDGLYPPRAIATPTNTAPTATIDRPVAHGRNPAQRPKAYPHTNNIPMATALERRSANLASPIRMKGMTIGNVDRKLSKQMPAAPSPSRFVSRGRSGSGN